MIRAWFEGYDELKFRIILNAFEAAVKSKTVTLKASFLI